MIRAYGRRELAQLYFPHLSPNSAWRCLHRWINLNQELCRKLNDLGYDAQTRIFTPEQVRVLSYYLGEPCKRGNIRSAGYVIRQHSV